MARLSQGCSGITIVTNIESAWSRMVAVAFFAVKIDESMKDSFPVFSGLNLWQVSDHHPIMGFV